MTGKTLRAARLRAGLSQAKLAHLAGVASGTVLRIESGNHRPSDLSVAKLKAALQRLQQTDVAVQQESVA